MPATSTAHTVTTTPTKIGTSRSRRTFLAVHPPASGTVYIGGSAVSATAGIPLAAGDTPFQIGETYKDDPTPNEQFWVVVASGTSTVAVNEITK